MASPGKNTRVPQSAAIITSRDNRWLKEFRMALRGGLPAQSGAVGAEGVRLVEEALRSGCEIEAVLFSESGERYRTRLVPLLHRPQIAFPVLKTTDRLFEGLADTEHPQGVAALVRPRRVTLDELLQTPVENSSPVLIAVLAGLQDPGNVGTILRTAAAFGATGAVTAGTPQSGSANPYGPKAIRASAGAAWHLPILTGMSLPILLTQFKVAGLTVLATCTSEVQSGAAPLLAPWQVDWRQPVALLIGNEGGGLPEEFERAADARVRIPISSGIESLNAAAAAAVLFYEAARQRAAATRSKTAGTPVQSPEPFQLT
jgi:TrmH family RNA methyltransferase